ncbi:hypothetical protein RCS94_06400 [Orbaceae bacterium ac157xtp]
MPNFSISLNSVLSSINSRSLLSFLSSTIYPSYGIYYARGENANKRALDFNSVINFSTNGESVITTAPVAVAEGLAGNYSSINKVVQPSKITMRIAIEGATAFAGMIPRIPFTDNLSVNLSSRSDVINKLEQMKNNADIYNIETPDRVYENFDLINYNFVMSAQSGITLLMVDLIFQEVRTLVEINNAIVAVKTAATKEAQNPVKEVL